MIVEVTHLWLWNLWEKMIFFSPQDAFINILFRQATHFWLIYATLIFVKFSEIWGFHALIMEHKVIPVFWKFQVETKIFIVSKQSKKLYPPQAWMTKFSNDYTGWKSLLCLTDVMPCSRRSIEEFVCTFRGKNDQREYECIHGVARASSRELFIGQISSILVGKKRA